MLTTGRGIKVLGRSDLAEFIALTAQDPVVNVFAEHRGRSTGLDTRWLAGEVWGRYDDQGHLRAACHVGANLVPVECDTEDAIAFAAHARTRPRRISTIVGPHEAVDQMWAEVAPTWGPARELRWKQPHLVLDQAPKIDGHPQVRRSKLGNLDELYPACVAMYTEEVGISPEIGGGAQMYRARIRQLIDRGWSFAWIQDGKVVFKAEVACATPAAAQIQGVWVTPDRRGEGLAAAGLAAVIDAVRRDIAPVVSLYVNEWNDPARATYARLGFTETARFSTIMF